MLNLGLSQTQDIIMMGDVNIDVMKKKGHSKQLNDFLCSNNLKQIIKTPTRITETSSSIIDHIYTNNPDFYAHWGLWNQD